MTELTRDAVLERLSLIEGSNGKDNIVDAGMISGVFVDGGKVIASITVAADQAQAMEPLRKTVEAAISEMTGVEKATAILTAERKAGETSTAPQQTAPKTQSATSSSGKPGIPGIEQIVAVASGKGGVGKSTTSVNLALALSALGKKVGILDADIYGPSMPRLLGITGKPTANGKILDPIEAYGIKVMSMGFLVEEETPMIWRGPMVISALTQMLREVAWAKDGESLDVLIVDMPPGTGDAQLTMAQQVPLAGAVIVSTPQDIALIDARKGLNMFKRVDVPILGIVENMSTFICPSCGERSDIFGHGGAREEAERLGAPFLGEVPLHIDIRTNSDAGTPIVVANPDSTHGLIYKEIAANVLGSLDQNAPSAGPSIVFE